jgi:hypothetical protein
MSIINGRPRIFSVLLVLLAITGHAGRAQSVADDPIGFKGGYKALSRLCETNLSGAASLLANDYSRGFFLSITIPAGADTVTDIAFLTAIPPEMAPQIVWALKATNGQWMKRDQARRLLIPIFFCQSSPPSNSFSSQLLVANNAGFNIPGSPDQWPEAAEGTWIHPICPLIPASSQRPTAAEPPAPAPTPAAAPQTAATPPASQPYTPATAAAPQPSSSAVAVADSTANSGIYRTQADFDARRMTYPSTFPLEEKSLLSWSALYYVTYGTVRVRTSPTNKDYQEFPAGSIFGFRSGNIRYIYLKPSKRYLSVVYTGAPFYLFMSVEKQSSTNDNPSMYGVFMYAKTLDGPLKEFTRKRIDEDFGSDPKMAADLQVLRKDLDKHSVSMSPGDFEVCRLLAKDCLSKYTPH